MGQRCAYGLVVLLTATVVSAPSAKHVASTRPPSFDWPQWRGPDRTAACQETNLLTSWPEKGPPLVWKAKGMGGSYCTPSVSGGRIFGMGAYKADEDQDEKNEAVWALDEATGKLLWKTVITPSAPQVGYGEGPRCTPTVDGNRVYALGVGGNLVCLDAKTGKEIWKKSYADDFEGRMMSKWGYCESPLVDGDRLICTPGGPEASIVALDKKNGKTIWKAAVPDAEGAGYASVTVAEVGKIRMYVQWLNNCLAGVAAKDGKFLWSYSQNANSTANIPTPLIRGNEIFCSTGYGAGSALLKLVPTKDGVEAKEIYFLQGEDLQNHHGGMVRVGDHVYMGHGHNAGAPTCVEWKTGKVVWRESPSPGKGSAAVLYADGHLYFRYDGGPIVLIEATPTAYKETGKFKLPTKSGKPGWSHPVIANGKLYLLDQDILLCYDVKQHP